MGDGMNNIFKYEVKFVHEDKEYNAFLYQADEESKVKFSIGGKVFTYKGDTETPPFVKELLENLHKENLSSEKELVDRISSPKYEIERLSMTKLIYTVGINLLLHKSKTHSESSIKFINANPTTRALRGCSPGNRSEIDKIIKASQCIPEEIFEIANHIQHEDPSQVELANAIRNTARPFNLRSTVERICKQITEHYFDIKMSSECVSEIENTLKSGAYEGISDTGHFAERVTADLRRITRDRHFQLNLKSDIPTAEVGSKEVQEKRQLDSLQSRNFGFGKVQLLPNGVCLLEIRKFESPNEMFNGEQPTRKKALELLEQIRKLNPTAVVFDLRLNDGGNPHMVALICSHFIEGQVLLGSFQYKPGEEPRGNEFYSFPMGEYKTDSEENLPTRNRMTNTPLYVLTSDVTLSAAESFTYQMRTHRQATVVGEVTGGAASICKLFDAGEEFCVAVPIGTMVLPEGPNWQGVGLIPNVLSEPSEALAHVEALIKDRMAATRATTAAPTAATVGVAV